MIKIEQETTYGWEEAIRGMRNPLNSWERSDTSVYDEGLIVGPNDHDLMMKLAKGGPAHAKYRRMITVYVDITAPLYWWKNFDTYKVGTVANSCSTMHKIHDKEFTLDDFSIEHLIAPGDNPYVYVRDDLAEEDWTPFEIFNEYLLQMLNACREAYLKTKDKKYWWQMIQLLPSSYNQKRTVMLNYEVLVGIYKWRKNHKLDEWRQFCEWIEQLPYSELITGENKEEK
jgi:hypothetical protein